MSELKPFELTPQENVDQDDELQKIWAAIWEQVAINLDKEIMNE